MYEIEVQRYAQPESRYYYEDKDEANAVFILFSKFAVEGRVYDGSAKHVYMWWVKDDDSTATTILTRTETFS